MIGVLGGGQLGRMLALAGIPLGERFSFLEPAPACPAADVGDVVAAAYDDPAGLDALAAVSDVITYEFENVPAASVERLLDAGAEVHPGVRPLAAAQDRVAEKELFARTGLAVPDYFPVDEVADLERALDSCGGRVVLKTRSGGYDGKGQALVEAAADPEQAFRSLGASNLIAEQVVEFERELSLIAARGRDGSVVVYPLVENSHAGGILRKSVAPAPGISEEVQRAAEERAGALLEELDYVGVLAVELFEAEGRLLGNEIAPRVHNSGHWTIEGAETSQFENHVRAVAGLPLGRASARGHSVMLNVIGKVPAVDELLRLGCHVHLYGKEPRAGRKLGHVTITDEDPQKISVRAQAVAELIGKGV